MGAHQVLVHGQQLPGVQTDRCVCAGSRLGVLLEPLYDVGKGTWATEWCEDLAPGMKMPELVWPSQVVGTVTPVAADITGLRWAPRSCPAASTPSRTR